MRRTGKGKHVSRLANFLVAAAVLIICNVALGFVTSRHSAAIVISAVIGLITVVLLVLIRIRQQKTTRALIEKISHLGEAIEQERKDCMMQSAAHRRRAVPRNGQTEPDSNEC